MFGTKIEGWYYPQKFGRNALPSGTKSNLHGSDTAQSFDKANIIHILTCKKGPPKPKFSTGDAGTAPLPHLHVRNGLEPHFGLVPDP
jgi:hypothetical protein